MVDADSVMKSAIRSVLPSSDPPCVGNGQIRAAEATLGTEYRERDMERWRMVGEGQVIFLAHCRAIYKVCRQVVGVTVKVQAKVRVKVEAKGGMLGTALASFPLAQHHRVVVTESVLCLTLEMSLRPCVVVV